MFRRGVSSRDATRLESAQRRVEDRVDSLQRDTNGMGARLDQRMDVLAERITDMQRQNTVEHERVMERLGENHDEVAERVELVEGSVKDLTVKVGVEVGLMRNAAETVEKQRRAWHELMSAEFLTRYRLLVIVVALLVAVFAGDRLVRLVETALF